MTIALLFSILMLIWLVFGIRGLRRQPGTPPTWDAFGGDLILFILLLLLGWAVFGPLIDR